MAITIGSNIASLSAQRQLVKNTDSIGTVFERLASGQRINRASDDAAGLAISSILNTDARVFGQGIRNVNDAISLLSTAEAAVNELRTIQTRIMELSEQSANGTFSRQQRLALDEEANLLHHEYNRIVASTTFNDRALIDQSINGLSMQVGYSSVDVSLGEGIQRNIGTGEFEETLYASAGQFRTGNVNIGDINNDGNLDAVVGTPASARRLLGNSDGTFTVSAVGGISTVDVSMLADVNNDGNLDFIGSRDGDNVMRVLLGNGDGTFGALTTFSTGVNPSGFDFGDVDGNGIIDMVVHANDSDELNVFLGNGDGSFRDYYSISTTDADGGGNEDVNLVDMNGDDILDIVHSSATPGTLKQRTNVLLGDGSGNFTLTESIHAISTYTQRLDIADFNHDGINDVVGDQVLFIGNGDGTLTQVMSFASASTENRFADLNGDGNQDIVSSNGEILYGAGDGSFTTASGPVTEKIELADFNKDGVLDILSFENDVGFRVFLQDAETSSTVARPNLTTRQDSLESLESAKEVLQMIAEELGNIGAAQSRLSTAVTNLHVARENYNAAANFITDIDVAQESGELVRRNILQQAGAAILGQANLQPAIALQLL